MSQFKDQVRSLPLTFLVQETKPETFSFARESASTQIPTDPYALIVESNPVAFLVEDVPVAFRVSFPSPYQLATLLLFPLPKQI